MLYFDPTSSKQHCLYTWILGHRVLRLKHDNCTYFKRGLKWVKTNQLLLLMFRFHNASNEPALVTSIVPLLRDDVQLSVDEYRNKLYKVISRTDRKLTKPMAKSDT